MSIAKGFLGLFSAPRSEAGFSTTRKFGVTSPSGEAVRLFPRWGMLGFLFFYFSSAFGQAASIPQNRIPVNKQGDLGASLLTDKFDYSPGDTVWITARGFAAGESVEVAVTHRDVPVIGGENKNPWKVSASESGTFRTPWVIPYDGSVGETLMVSASGGASHSAAKSEFLHHNTVLTITGLSKNPVCPGETFEVCLHLAQQCSGGSQAPLAGRPILLFIKSGCGVSIGQQSRDTAYTDVSGNACYALKAPSEPGEYAVRAKFREEEEPEPCPNPGNSACNPNDPNPERRCVELSSASDCEPFEVSPAACPCPTIVITCPDNIERSNDAGKCGSAVTFSATTEGGCAPVNVVCTPPSSSNFPIGLTSIKCVATDASGDQDSCEFEVTVNDSEKPSLACPEGIVQSNDVNQCDAVVNYTASASDNCGGVTLVCTPPSGSTFSMGNTPVKCVATDASGNQDSCQFTVTVQDREPPEISCPPNITVNTGPNQPGVTKNFTVTAADLCSGASVVCAPPSGSLFPVGATTVTCTATDGSGNADSCSFTITVNSQLLFQGNGSGSGDELGFTVAGGGDVNGDGVADFIIGAPGTDPLSQGEGSVLPDAGSVYVYSGATGQLLYQKNGGASGERLGGSAGISADVDGDGHDDFIVGAPGASPNGLAGAGSAYVYSGANGNLLYQVNGGGSGDRLGGSAGISADIDGDGNGDFIVGAPGADPNGLVDAGLAFVYSGATGNLIYRVNGSSPGDRLGGSAGMTDDANGDGYGDFIAGAPGADPNGLADAGSAYVYSGKDGTVLYQVNGSGSGDRLGGSAGMSGDVNGDGNDDFIVGAPQADPNGLADAGSAYVYSGADGSLLYQVNGTGSGERLGGSAGMSGDVNGDGNDEFIVGAPGADVNGLSDAGTVMVFSGRDGLPLFEKNGSAAGDRLGGSAGMFEEGENGEVHFIVGAPGADPNGLMDAGSAFVYEILFKGDLNGDGKLTPADIILLLNCTFAGIGSCPLSVADVDCDGSLVNPTDVVKLLNAVFLGVPITCSSL